MPLTKEERAKMEAESDARIARRKKYKGDDNFQVPKWMLDDNHPETKQGSSSPKVGENMEHKTNRESPSLKTLERKIKSRKKYLDSL